MVYFFPTNNMAKGFEIADKTKKRKRQLNLNFMDVVNQTYCIGKYDLPYILSDMSEYPDYIALYGEPGLYHKTNNTCVAFYQYDNVFDGINGIYNAVYYDIAELKMHYLDRFMGVKYFITPDYSLCGDVPRAENIYRLFRARIVSVWLAMESGSIVIPNITYSSMNDFPVMLEGMQDCKVVAFSTKGSMRKPVNKELLRKAIVYTVDHLPLKAIIVYSVSARDEHVYELFDYAIAHGINIIIPQNTLKLRNMTPKEAA